METPIDPIARALLWREAVASTALDREEQARLQTWVRCAGCNKEYRSSALCQTHGLCFVCHQEVPHG